jgi:type II secretory pathway component PulM
LPTGRAGQLLALAILCLVLGGVYLLLVSPILDLYSQREATLADRRMLAPRLSAARRSPLREAPHTYIALITGRGSRGMDHIQS